MRYGMRLTEAIREADIEGTYSRGARAGFPRGYTLCGYRRKIFVAA